MPLLMDEVHRKLSYPLQFLMNVLIKALNHMFKIGNSSRFLPSKRVCLDYSYNNIVTLGGTSRKRIKSIKTEKLEIG